ncbi:MAG TPA: peroxiredoxin [Hyphomonas atlantica]|uniref:thioredoxin-dependent peroxiredoxin n=1 Tax=Hyphomonas atlantica TaxID=1280948 RepID=A0A3B9L3I5_9PROT|nr:peroxiredoxin [Hyphomonas atlantica]
MANPLQAGDKAPNFSMPSTEGDISLKDFEGSYLVLYFYPRDNTPGCTTEAKDFTALVDEFGARNAKIVGVSRDSMTKHENFKAKQDLRVILASDEDGKTTESYGTWVEKNMYGKTHMGVARETFLIDPNGKIIKLWKKVRVKGHAQEVLEALPE